MQRRSKEKAEGTVFGKDIKARNWRNEEMIENTYIKIVNPNEDMQGNDKENIFLALESNSRYLAHSYVWAYENYHTCYAKPRNIFICIEVPETDDFDTKKVRELLFKSALERAHILKEELWKGQKTRIYGGANTNRKDILDFLTKQGFVSDDSVFVMEAFINDGCKGEIPCQYTIKKSLLDSDEDQEAFFKRHNSIFPNEIDKSKLEHFKCQNNWAVFSMYNDGKIAGECMVFEKDKAGYIEAFYTLPEFRGIGASEVLIKHVLGYLFERGYKKADLTVWERNKRAIRFYEKNGFKMTGEKTEEYPGIDVE